MRWIEKEVVQITFVSIRDVHKIVELARHSIAPSARTRHCRMRSHADIFVRYAEFPIHTDSFYIRPIARVRDTNRILSGTVLPQCSIAPFRGHEPVMQV